MTQIILHTPRNRSEYDHSDWLNTTKEAGKLLLSGAKGLRDLQSATPVRLSEIPSGGFYSVQIGECIFTFSVKDSEILAFECLQFHDGRVILAPYRDGQDWDDVMGIFLDSSHLVVNIECYMMMLPPCTDTQLLAFHSDALQHLSSIR